MTPQERDLIQGVFDRLERNGVGSKDAAAEALIADQMRKTPDAAYGLTQAVIVLEIGLSQAQQKMAELQRQLDEVRAAPAPAAGGGFLGGFSPWGGSVPRSGAAPAPQAPAPAYYAPSPPPPAYGQPAAGGFLRNAATMAAGVAGGTLIAEGLSSLFGGGHQGFGGSGGGFAGGSPWGQPGVVENVTINNYGTGTQDGRQDAGFDSNADAGGVQDASYDDSDAGFDDSSDA